MSTQTTDPAFDIRTEAQLRAVIGDEVPGIADKNIDHLDQFALDYISKSSFLMLSTADAQGNMDTSPKGDAAGFVEAVDAHTLLIPDRPGNKLAYGHLNILQNPQLSLIFLIPGTPETLRVAGLGSLTADPAVLARLAARGKPATLALEVKVTEVFFHCAKAFIRSKLWQPESWSERHKVSFGEMFAKNRRAKMASADKDESPGLSIGDSDTPDEVLAEVIDSAVEQDYRENL